MVFVGNPLVGLGSLHGAEKFVSSFVARFPRTLLSYRDAALAKVPLFLEFGVGSALFVHSLPTPHRITPYNETLIARPIVGYLRLYM
jgi:hypothetical protein